VKNHKDIMGLWVFVFFGANSQGILQVTQNWTLYALKYGFLHSYTYIGNAVIIGMQN
jgi:hypothetical protein